MTTNGFRANTRMQLLSCMLVYAALRPHCRTKSVLHNVCRPTALQRSRTPRAAPDRDYLAPFLHSMNISSGDDTGLPHNEYACCQGHRMRTRSHRSQPTAPQLPSVSATHQRSHQMLQIFLQAAAVGGSADACIGLTAYRAHSCTLAYM